jgi:hypothetical protein
VRIVLAIPVMVTHPIAFCLVALLALWLTAQLGAWLRRRWPLSDDARDDFGIVLAACLTMLGLLIGFSFSMAITRYDQRKNYEEAEANAIGTEYLRADLLPAAESAAMRVRLRNYLGLRIRFYQVRDEDVLRQIDADTARGQAEMWSAVLTEVAAKPNAVLALAVSGMNDVLNSQGYTQAAWWNRIPRMAWALMMAMAVCCNLLVGYGGHSVNARVRLLLILPVVVSISFLLVADIDSPRRGFIHVFPQNLVSLSEKLK